MPISIRNEQPLPVKLSVVRRAAKTILTCESATSADVSILLTDDRTIHGLNLRYRGQDKPTDVLSFALRDELPSDAAAIPDFPIPADHVNEALGDVVISVEAAARQADQFGVSLDHELSLLTMHGILHLLGYDDVTDDGAEEMTSKETAALAKIGITRR